MLDITKIKNVLVTTVLTAIIATAGYILSIGDVFKVNSHALINVAVITALTTIVSLIKNIGTNPDGKFLGMIKIAPSKY